MRELKEEAKRHHERKLESYGGKCRAHGGRAEHPDVKEDEALIRKEVKPSALKHEHHKADGGPITGGAKMPSLGHRRGKPGGGKGKTNVNVIMAGGKPGGDGAPGPLPPPPGGLAGLPPRPAAPMMPPPRPPMAGPGAGPAGPMKRGGAARHHEAKHHRGKHEAGHGHR
jgi:hypothetical protein